MAQSSDTIILNNSTQMATEYLKNNEYFSHSPYYSVVLPTQRFFPITPRGFVPLLSGYASYYRLCLLSQLGLVCYEIDFKPFVYKSVYWKTNTNYSRKFINENLIFIDNVYNKFCQQLISVIRTNLRKPGHHNWFLWERHCTPLQALVEHWVAQGGSPPSRRREH